MLLAAHSRSISEAQNWLLGRRGRALVARPGVFPHQLYHKLLHFFCHFQRFLEFFATFRHPIYLLSRREVVVVRQLSGEVESANEIV